MEPTTSGESSSSKTPLIHHDLQPPTAPLDHRTQHGHTEQSEKRVSTEDRSSTPSKPAEDALDHESHPITDAEGSAGNTAEAADVGAGDTSKEDENEAIADHGLAVGLPQVEFAQASQEHTSKKVEEQGEQRPLTTETAVEEAYATSAVGVGLESDECVEREHDKSAEESRKEPQVIMGDSSPVPPVPPKSPRHQTYQLPIGGGPKKAVLPIMARLEAQAAAREKEAKVAAAAAAAARDKKDASSSTKSAGLGRSNSLTSSRSKTQGASLLKGRKKVRKVSDGTRRPVQRPSHRRTVSASDLRDVKISEGGDASPRKRAVTMTSKGEKLSDSAEKQQKGTANGHRPKSAPTPGLGLPGGRKMTRRRPTTSSVLMVEGQMFELNDGDDAVEAQGAAIRAWLPKAARGSTSNADDFADTTRESQADDDVADGLDVRDEPMIYTDDEIEDVPPPGAYAIHPPSKARLAMAAHLPLYDEWGNIVDFGSVFAARRTLICFLRHWLCPFCQMFSQSLQAIDRLPLERAGLDLVVVGQGHWHVTKSYKEVMKIPKFVRMYADPSRKIYKALGMTLRTNDMGPACTRPDYQTMSVMKASMSAIKKGVFDMPLRPPGDLKLLGGEFILGPGLQCSFTHRMVTTRGHLDLPRILVQAGCDLSLKTPADVLEEQQRPASVRSTDHITARRLARKLGRRNRARGDLKNVEGREKKGGDLDDQANSLRILSGKHANRGNPRTLPKSFAKKKSDAMPDVRAFNIGYPQMQADHSTLTEVDGDVTMIQRERRSESTPRGHRNGIVNEHDILTVDDQAQKPPVDPTANPLSAVLRGWSAGMHDSDVPPGATSIDGITKTASLSNLHSSFSRPPRSTERPAYDRPPLPGTSSAAAFAAATARTSLSRRNSAEKGETQSQRRERFYNGTLSSSESMPTLHRGNISTTSVQTVQPRAYQQGFLHQRVPTAGSTITTMSIDSSSRPDTSDSVPTSASYQSNPPSDDMLDRSFPASVKRSPSLKRSGNNSSGVPLSAFERRLPQSPRLTPADFSASSPSLPLNDGWAPPHKEDAHKSPQREDFGEDTEYKRLDPKVLKTPPIHVDENGHAGVDETARDVPISVSENDEGEEGDANKWQSTDPARFLTPTSGLTSDLEDDLQKTPVPRKISLEPGDLVSDLEPESHRAAKGHSTGSFADAAPPLNRGSIQQAPVGYLPVTSPPAPVYQPVPALARDAASFASNPLLAGIPPHLLPPSTFTRALAPAPTPLFASILAEETSRVQGQTSTRREPLGNGKRTNQSDSMQNPLLSSVKKQDNSARGNFVPEHSFLDDLDVHDSFRRQQSGTPTGTPTAGSSRGSATDDSTEDGDEDEETDEDDDWAPLQASGNVIPARLSNDDEDGGREAWTGSERSHSQTEDEIEEDDLGEEDAHIASYKRDGTESPSQLVRPKSGGGEYVLKQVTSRPSTAPASSRPRKIKLKTNSLRMYQSGSMSRLSSFREEEEEEQESKSEEQSTGESDKVAAS